MYQAQVNPYKKYTEKLPFQMPEVSAPVIPNYTVNLKKFGAVGDGVTLREPTEDGLGHIACGQGTARIACRL